LRLRASTWQRYIRWQSSMHTRAAHGMCHHMPFDVAIGVMKAVLGEKLNSCACQICTWAMLSQAFEGAKELLTSERCARGKTDRVTAVPQEPMVNHFKHQISSKTSRTIAFTFTSVEPGSS